jgi:hypothetical protein
MHWGSLSDLIPPIISMWQKKHPYSDNSSEFSPLIQRHGREGGHPRKSQLALCLL